MTMMLFGTDQGYKNDACFTMKIKRLINTGVLVCLSLALIFFYGCNSSDRSTKSADQDSAKVVNEHLVDFIDLVAGKLAHGALADGELVTLTDSFSRYFPIVVYRDGDSIPEHTVMVTRNRALATGEPERISLSLPEAIGSSLSVQLLTDHFGPLAPEGILAREHETPFPFIISLKAHLKLPDEKMSMHIAASDYPEAKNNQIKSIELINLNP